MKSPSLESKSKSIIIYVILLQISKYFCLCADLSISDLSNDSNVKLSNLDDEHFPKFAILDTSADSLEYDSRPRFVIRGSYGSYTDAATTEDGSLMSTSLFSQSYYRNPSSKLSLESSKSSRSIRFAEVDSDLLDYGVTKNCLMNHLSIFDSKETIISGTVSEASDNEYVFEFRDCFNDLSVEGISMLWIFDVFIPYLLAGSRILPENAFEILELVKYKFENENAIHNITVEEGEILFLVGDIHGQFEDLVRIFEQNGFPSGANKFIFNGDLVDRGPNSIECVLTLFLMKICAPHNIFITRGNHESHTCGDGTFKDECFKNSWEPLKFFETCHSVFDVLPLGYIINKKIFVCHGGLPHKFDVKSICDAEKPNYTAVQHTICMNLLWNDPQEGLGMAPSHRGGSTLSFGQDITSDFLLRHNFSLLIRSHEYHPKGFFFCHDDLCLTIFSAPNYCGMNNVGVILKINSDLTYNIIQINSNVVDMNNSAIFQYTSKFYSNDLRFDELKITTFDQENDDIFDDVKLKFKETTEDASATVKIHDIDNLLDSFELIPYPSEEQEY